MEEVITIKVVSAATGAAEGVVKTLATFTDPAELTGGDSDHQGVILDILGDDRAAADKGTFADGMTTDDGAVGSEGGTFSDERPSIGTVNGEVGTGRGDVSKDAGGAAEHVVLYLYTFIDRDIVLDADPIADVHIVANVDILTQRAVPAETGTALDMAEMPDLRSLTDFHIIIDITRRMYVKVLHIFDYELYELHEFTGDRQLIHGA